jgi:hypothetical protein
VPQRELPLSLICGPHCDSAQHRPRSRDTGEPISIGGAIRFPITHHREPISEVARRLRVGRPTLQRKPASLGCNAKTPQYDGGFVVIR